jgi:hypothetical protein
MKTAKGDLKFVQVLSCLVGCMSWVNSLSNQVNNKTQKWFPFSFYINHLIATGLFCIRWLSLLPNQGSNLHKQSHLQLLSSYPMSELLRSQLNLESAQTSNGHNKQGCTHGLEGTHKTNAAGELMV